LADRVRRAEMHHCVKFRQKRWSGFWHIAIFRFFKRAVATILDFKSCKILLALGVWRPRCITMPNFVKISQPVFEISVFRFFKMAASAILDLFGTYLDHPRRPLGSLYHRAKFGCHRCSSFDNTKVSIFGAFGLKTPIHAPKLGFLDDFTNWPLPKCGAISTKH